MIRQFEFITTSGTVYRYTSNSITDAVRMLHTDHRNSDIVKIREVPIGIHIGSNYTATNL